ncbi:MAG: SCO family protein [Gammaproteobacteria bacterium]|nr:SCO family protein [Gammaproteobacteria bacterium]MDH3560338.1 SCO family protein [Gammaproteobacteria bacterium]
MNPLRPMVFLVLVLTAMAGSAQSPDHAAAGHNPDPAAHDIGAGGHVDASAGPSHDSAAHEPGPGYDEAAALALSQEAVGRTVGDYTFLDGKGREIALSSLRGKPVVISLIYTSCYHVCPTITTNLASVVKVARDALGEDSFSLLTIGFDTPNDTPDRMRVFAGQRGIDINDWHFVSAGAETMRGLSADVGFSYFSSPKGFDHMIQATVLDGEGKVYRQVYGMAPEPPSVVEPLKEILWGKQVAATPIAGWINNIKLFCTVYDPTTGKYQFDYSPFIGFGIGVLVLSGIAWVIVRSWRESSSSGPAV